MSCDVFIWYSLTRRKIIGGRSTGVLPRIRVSISVCVCMDVCGFLNDVCIYLGKCRCSTSVESVGVCDW